MTFLFYIGGYGRNSYRLTVSSGKLHCSEYYGIPTEPAKVIPVDGNRDWEKLMDFLRTCDWRRRYDSDILDGTQWELKVRGEGTRISSYGSNAYPENFDEFLSLLNELIGKSGMHIKG